MRRLGVLHELVEVDVEIGTETLGPSEQYLVGDDHGGHLDARQLVRLALLAGLDVGDDRSDTNHDLLPEIVGGEFGVPDGVPLTTVIDGMVAVGHVRHSFPVGCALCNQTI